VAGGGGHEFQNHPTPSPPARLEQRLAEHLVHDFVVVAQVVLHLDHEEGVHRS
jgi:hypothetical protein